MCDDSEEMGYLISNNSVASRKQFQLQPSIEAISETSFNLTPIENPKMF